MVHVEPNAGPTPVTFDHRDAVKCCLRFWEAVAEAVRGKTQK